MRVSFNDFINRVFSFLKRYDYPDKVQVICPKCNERLYAESFTGVFSLPKCPTCDLREQMKSNDKNLFIYGYTPSAQTIKAIAAIRSEFPEIIIDLNGQRREAIFSRGDVEERLIIGYEALDCAIETIKNSKLMRK